MKYGLIVFINTDNIGDDIQSYALEKFFPHVDYLIDREKLDSFHTENGETVATIFGGWYLHKVLNWPPSPFLNPILPVSIHFRMNKFIMDDYGGEWLKKFSPIGCRDKGTLEHLESFGIPAYLSGCCTLTLTPFENVPKHGKIILTDLPEEAIEFVKARTKKETVIISHKTRESAQLIKAIAESVAMTNDEKQMLFGADIKEPIPFKEMTWAQRRVLVEELLKFYQGASLVVTSRLHVALPCLALGTPVLLVSDKRKNYRFSTFVPYVNSTNTKNFLDGKFLYDFDAPQASPGGHEIFADKVRQACNDFITACENDGKTFSIDVDTWLDGYNKNQRLKKIITDLNPEKKSLRKF